MRIDSLGLRTDLAILELQGSTVVDHGDHLVVRTEANPTFWWGNFLLLPTDVPREEIPRWTERFEAELPGARHRAFGFVSAQGDHSGWVDLGYAVETDVTLVNASVPSGGPMAGGLEIRMLESGDDWYQSAVVGGSGVPDDERDDRLVFETRRARAQRGLVEAGHARWFGAFAGHRLVGSLGIVRLGTLARYQDVITLPEFRRRGIAGALVRAGGEWALAQPGVEQLVIVAEEGGPAIGLYRRAGFVEASRHAGASRAP